MTNSGSGCGFSANRVSAAPGPGSGCRRAVRRSTVLLVPGARIAQVVLRDRALVYPVPGARGVNPARWGKHRGRVKSYPEDKVSHLDPADPQKFEKRYTLHLECICRIRNLNFAH